METRQSIAERVVNSVATATNTDPVELPCLYDVIEPDALNTAIQTLSNGEICFDYADHTVSVQSDGTVTVTDDSMSQGTQAAPATDD